MTTLSFKVTAGEARAIREQAQRARLSVSEFLRLRVGQASPPPGKVRLVRSRRTGARIFSGPADLPPLTTETVREMLNAFP